MAAVLEDTDVTRKDPTRKISIIDVQSQEVVSRLSHPKWVDDKYVPGYSEVVFSPDEEELMLVGNLITSTSYVTLNGELLKRFPRTRVEAWLDEDKVVVSKQEKLSNLTNEMGYRPGVYILDLSSYAEEKISNFYYAGLLTK